MLYIISSRLNMYLYPSLKRTRNFVCPLDGTCMWPFFVRCQTAVPQQNQAITGGLVSPLSMGYENIPCYVNRFIGPQSSLVHHRL